MRIGVRKEADGGVSIYRTAYTDGRFDEEVLSKPPYNFTKVEIPDDCEEDCQEGDFNEDLSFNIEKYKTRKLEEQIQNLPMHQEIELLKSQLANMDYKTCKYVDGDYTEEEWASIVSERKSIRLKIRDLEESIRSSLKGG